MSDMKAIKNRIKSVRKTQKVTGAMYLISATKLQRAKADLKKTRPYFEALKTEIKRIFRTTEGLESRYFFPQGAERDYEGTYGYLVITADKGLVGAYNQNVIRETLRMLEQHGDNRLYIVGDSGRQFFASHDIPGTVVETGFRCTAQYPTIARARAICRTLTGAYDRGELRKIFVIYSDLSGLNTQAHCMRLLPLHQSSFASSKEEKRVHVPFEFSPSTEEVLDSIIPSYITGFIYSALIASFCSEENSRMIAMDSANTNAQKLLEELDRQYNHVRQSDITQEIAEISSGSRSLKNRKAR